MTDQKKKIAIIVTAVVLAVALVVGLVVLLTKKDTPNNDDAPVNDGVANETYYFDAGIQEYTLTLNEDKTFVLFIKNTYPGTYTLTDGALTLDFSAEGKETVNATLADNVITMTYDGASYRFLKKVSFTVSYESNGGSGVEAQTVLNGKTVVKPADPTRDGYLFIGWYADSEFKTPFEFGSQPVTADTTIYARWTEKTADNVEYTVDFNANYENADALAEMTTVGGKLFGAPTLTREGYSFKGWWVSMSDDASKLSYLYEEGMSLDANTTLYALWESNDLGSKISAPLVNVSSGSISWNAVENARSYSVTITCPDGTVDNPDASGTTINYTFNQVGEYVIKVVANAQSGEANNSETVRYYTNKMLGRVYQFEVIDGNMLVYNTVENAEKYLITIVCGNPAHNHTDLDNGTSKTYSFANCEMCEGGIKFVVKAVADGYATSVSKTFVFERTLDAVEGLRYDEATQTVLWNEVLSATEYMVSVKCGNAAHNHEFVSNGNKTSVSLKECDALEGGIIVKVYPKTRGYNSSDVVEIKVEKTTIAAPAGLSVNGSVLSWNAVAGATKYEVFVGENKFEATETSFDLASALNGADGAEYAVTVRAIGESESLPSDALNVCYNAMKDQLTYSNGFVTWVPVIGAGSYEVQVNDGEILTVPAGAHTAPVILTKSGANVIKVRSVDGATRSEWATTEVYAYAISYDSLGGSEVAVQYKAVGDTIALPTTNKAGYTFSAWYNVPGGPESNGKVIIDGTVASATSMMLYAYYTPNKYTVVYDYGVGGSGEATEGDVYFEKHYQLYVPVADNATGAFGGWFSAPYGNGVQYTDAKGNSLAPWTATEGAELYAFWVDDALKMIQTKVNGKDAYMVTAGERISLLSEVTIPTTYKGLPVATIAGNAFSNCTNLKVINIPATIETISSVDPFAGCTSLEAVNVYAVEGVNNARFWSLDGVLFDNGVNASNPSLLVMPTGKTGTYRIPSNITEIPEDAFAGSSLSKVIIPTSVTKIGREAFANCAKLDTVTFETAEGEQALTIGARAFAGCTALEKITLPARLAEINLTKHVLTSSGVDVSDVDNAFAGCTALRSISVVSGSKNYKSVDGVLYSADGKTLVYCPATKADAFAIPAGVQAIAPGAFIGCNAITEVTVPNTVTLIGECAFYGLESKLAKVTFAGNAFNDMIIDDYAFTNCKALTDVIFEAGSKVATISKGAFMGCTSIENFTIPASASSIETDAFRDCTKLTNLTFAESGKTLEFGEDVFNNCTSLANVTLPANVSKIPGIFSGCTSLQSVNVAEDSQYFTSKDGVIFNKAETEVLFFPQGKTGEYTLPATVTTIANGVFRNVLDLDKLVIGNAVTTIGDEAFRNSSIGEIVFTGEATGELTIGAYAFENASIGTFTLPAHTKTIGNSAFENSVSTAIVLNEGLESIGDRAFAYAKSGSAVTVPASVKSIGEYSFAGENRGSSWYPDYVGVDVVLTVENSKLESIADHAFDTNGKIKAITVPANIMTIGNYAFYGCSALNVVEFAPESKLETIGAYAFAFSSSYNSSDLVTITLPKSLRAIGAYAFNNTALETVVFEEGGADAPDLILGTPYVDIVENYYTGAVTKELKIGHVFDYCQELTSVKFSSNVVEIGEYCFQYAGYYSDGVTVTFGDEQNPSRLKTIGAYAFRSSTLKSIVIPKSVQNLDPYVDTENNITYDRLGIGAYAFYSCYDALTSVIFEKGGTAPLTIGDNAFENCELLEAIELPNRLAPYTSHTGDVIAPLANGANVFYDCAGLTSITVEDGENSYYVDVDGIIFTADMKEIIICPAAKAGAVTIPATVTKIHDRAFLNCKNIDSVTFAGGTEPMTIGSEAFRNCAKITTIVLPTNVVSVGDYAFAAGRYSNDVVALESITLSKNLQNWNANILYNCTALKEIKVEEGSAYFYSDSGVLYNADKTILISYPISREGTAYTVLPTVKTITTEAFAKNVNIETVVLPAGLIEINASAFSECSKLKSVNVPNTVQLIDDWAFSNCTALTDLVFEMGGTGKMVVGKYAFQYIAATDVVLPATMSIVGNYVFSGSKLTNVTFEEGSKLLSMGDQVFKDTNIVSIVMPAGLQTLANETFFGCESLKNVTFGEGLVSIGYGTFSSCTALESVAFPASLRTMGKNTFFYEYYGDGVGCENLTSVTFGNGSQLTAIPEGTFAYSGLESFTVPANVTAIMDKDITTRYSFGAFQNCSSLKEVDFEAASQCKTIGAYAFHYCEALETVVIPSAVSTLGTYAFGYCSSLNDVTIPVTATQLGDYLFYYCESLKDVELKTNTTVLPAYMFAYCKNLSSVKIPVNVSEIGRNCFMDTKLEAFEVAEGNAFFAVVDGVLYNADKSQILVYPAYKNDALFTVPATVTSIDYGVLNGIESIKEIVFEEGETPLTIKEEAFYYMSNLVKVTLPARLTAVEEDAFYNCSGLMYINVPATATEETFGDDAFYGCTKLYEIYNESALVLEAGSDNYGGIAKYALNIYTPTEGSSQIVEDENGFITLTKTVDDETRVYLLGYSGTDTELTVPNNVTDIYSEAFAESTVTKVVLPDGLKTIGYCAFYYCEDLEEVNIPSSVVEIGEGAFYRCGSVQSMILPEGLEIIGDQAFSNCSGFDKIVIPTTVKSIGEQAFYYADVNVMNVFIPASVTAMGSQVFYGCGTMTIMVEAAGPTDDWASDWNKASYSANNMVLWGFTGEEITYTFETNGGSSVEQITSAEPITVPAAPTRDQYYFNGWYDNPECEGSPVTGSYYNSVKTTLYAKWLTQAEFEAKFAGTSAEYAIEAVNGASHSILDEDSSKRAIIYFKVTATEDVTLTISTVSGYDTCIYIYDNVDDANNLASSWYAVAY